MGEKKSGAFTKRYKKILGDMAKTPPIDGLLDELGRIEKIRDGLYRACENSDIIESYTNKSGATNDAIHPAIKEYKAYCKQFYDLCRVIEGVVKERQQKNGANAEPPDEFESLLGVVKGGK